MRSCARYCASVRTLQFRLAHATVPPCARYSAVAPGSDKIHRESGTSTVGGGRSPNSVHDSKLDSFYLCDPQWFRDTASRGPTTIVTPKSKFRTDPSDHVFRELLRVLVKRCRVGEVWMTESVALAFRVFQTSTLVNVTVAGDRWIERSGLVELSAGDSSREDIC
ncbi:hypothetical protein F511_13872 [Dorcoceras hygrometricum]|uniref:Uncharacterized protein n=1 Tax=Dorcoceras hygrometricum TaxID=472368 RepID=A0A2Z7B6I3_9LAMI|nr:hypothetical protein F511_13872 [Dorcoceras hygrometricum]